MLKTQVMDDLDSLLADLQATTTHIHQYQQSQQPSQGGGTTITEQGGYAQVTNDQGGYTQVATDPGGYAHVTTNQGGYSQVTTEQQSVKHPVIGDQGGYAQVQKPRGIVRPSIGQENSTHSRNSTPPPPPVPPHPAPEDVEENIYEHQIVRNAPAPSAQQQQAITPNQGATTSPQYHQNHTQSNGLPRAQPPLLKPHSKSPTSVVIPVVQDDPQSPPPPKPPTGKMTSLSSNLSELDSLLQDLSSAQFIAEVDRRNAENLTYHGAQNPLANSTPRPNMGQSRTVDSLLNELEDSINPTQRPEQNSSLTEMTHYEQIRQVHHTPQLQLDGQQHSPSPPRGPHPLHSAASSATRELEDLMSSLSEFKMSGRPQQVGEPPYALPNKPQRGGAVQVQNIHPASANQNMSSANQGQGYGGQGQGFGDYDQGHNGQGQGYGNQGQGFGDQGQGFGGHGQGHNSQGQGYGNQGQGFGGQGQGFGGQGQGYGSHGNDLSGHSNNGVDEEALIPTNIKKQENSRDDIDAMLGNLNTDMSKQGVNTQSKGHCGACLKPIIGQVITALGKLYHPEHFTCAHCKEELGTKNFFERDGQPFCERDYHNLFSPRCAYCKGPILDKCVTALDNTWHPEHFFCAKCGRPFGDDGFHEKDGEAYCREDYFETFAPKCGGCGRPIMDNYISALNRQWHPECFICYECRVPFNGGSFFEHEGMPYCETHYHARRGSLCASCHKPITGRCITAMYKKFHPEHFVCAFCLKQLNKGTFKEQNDKPYCHPCFAKLFG